MNDNITLNLSRDEVHLIYNALNEICNGIEIPEFEIRVGHSEVEAENLLHKIGELYDKQLNS